MSAIVCPSCGTAATAGAVFCDNCGYDLRNVQAAPPPPPPAQQGWAAPGGEAPCQACGHPNIAGAAYCENCGASLKQAVPPPTVVPQQVVPPQMVPPQVVPPPVQPPMVPQAALTGRFVVQGTNTSIPIPAGKTSIVMGREDPVSNIFPEIDLDPHGGQDSGVGRQHARFFVQGSQVLLEDMDSVNGTALNKTRLIPHQAVPVNDGDEIRLGKLYLIYYRS